MASRSLGLGEVFESEIMDREEKKARRSPGPTPPIG